MDILAVIDGDNVEIPAVEPTTMTNFWKHALMTASKTNSKWCGERPITARCAADNGEGVYGSQDFDSDEYDSDKYRKTITKRRLRKGETGRTVTKHKGTTQQQTRRVGESRRKCGPKEDPEQSEEVEKNNSSENSG